MFEYMDYNIAPWGWDLALYFFLVGTAAMAFVLLAAPLTIGGLRVLEPVQKAGAIVTLLILLVCAPLLIFDLGQPGRFLYPIIHFHASSPLAWGSVLLVLFGVTVVLFVAGLYGERKAWLRPVAIAGSILAFTMPLYTGWDLMAQQARELWHSVSIPVLFVALSFSSAAALLAVLLQAAGRMDEANTRLVRGVLLASVSVTLVLFVAEVLRMVAGSTEERQAWEFINAEFGFRFWGLTFVAGIAAPLALLAVRALAVSGAAVTAAAVLSAVGAYTFREIYVYAGQLPQLFY